MQSGKIHTSWGPSRAGSLTPPRRRHVPASPSPPQSDQGDDNCHRSVPDADKVQLQRVVSLDDARQPTGKGYGTLSSPEEGEMIVFREDQLAFAAIGDPALRTVNPSMVSMRITGLANSITTLGGSISEKMLQHPRSPRASHDFNRDIA